MPRQLSNLPIEPTPIPRQRPWWLIVGIIAVIVVVAGAVILWFRRSTPAATENGNQANLNVEIPELPSGFNQIPDQDRDRLTDNQEGEIGTNPAAADTDTDQLNDYDEVAIYKTDPKNPDSDGDGFSDGYEVNRGFNPSGEGKLLNINSAL